MHSESFEKVIKPDFHLMINNASKRILKKYLLGCRLADELFLCNEYATNNQEVFNNNFKKLTNEMRSERANEFEEI